MALAPGTRLGPYKITAKVGAGGMGEVYRAADTNLGRDVAIKVLPAAFAHDVERLARFDREAKALATLNHPNVAAIYGVERSAETTALVMELVEGDTLADRLLRGAIPIEEARTIAIQIAEALQAAHEQGIIHRDLKPANIKIRSDGTVKVLDFGLAKTTTQEFEEVGATQGLAMGRAPLTRSGVILGTAAYMSPEQASGGPIDARTDIWAFGCVLYEMLTGRRAFGRPTVPETLATVLGGSPDWSCLPAAVPPQMRALLRRSLARDRRKRVAHVSVVLFVLEEQHLLSAESRDAPGDRLTTGRMRRTSVFVASVLLVSTALAAGSWWFALRRTPSRVVRTTIAANTIISGTDRNFALTPDGSRLAYISGDAGQILVRPLEALEAVPILTTPADLRGVFPSPDGRWLAYVENNFTLKKIPLTGGPPVSVLHMDGPSRGTAWGPNDTIVFATAAADTGLQQVAAGGGPVTVLTQPDHQRGEADHVQPAWLPGGRNLLFTITATSGGLDAAKIAVLDLAARTWRTVIEGGHAARYVDSGHLVYAAAGALWAARFDLSRLNPSGASVEVLPQVSVGTSGGVALFDVAGSGTLVYPRAVPYPARDKRIMVWVDREGRETPLAAPPDTYRHPRLSPDGRRLAIFAEEDIFIWDLTRQPSSLSRMTFAPGLDWFPVWMPDGRRIVFGSWRGGGFSNLYMQEPGSAAAERVTESPEMQLPTDVTPDGATVVFHSFAKKLEALRLQAPHQPVTLVETPLEERNGAISPDGRWLAYEAEGSSRSGELDVYVRPFPDVDRGVWQVTRGGGTFPLWARSGRELFYVKTNGTMMRVPVETTVATWRAGTPIELFRGPYFIRGDGSLGRNYDVAPDGRRFLMLKSDPTEADRDLPHFVVVQNWGTELERQVP